MTRLSDIPEGGYFRLFSGTLWQKADAQKFWCRNVLHGGGYAIPADEVVTPCDEHGEPQLTIHEIAQQAGKLFG